MPYVTQQNRAKNGNVIQCAQCVRVITEAQGYFCCDKCLNSFHAKCKNILGQNITRLAQNATWFCSDGCLSLQQPANDVNDADSNLPPGNNNNNDDHNSNNIDNNNSDLTINLPNSPSLSDVMTLLLRMEKKLSALDDMQALVSSLASKNEVLVSRVNTLENELLKLSSKFNLLEAAGDQPHQQLNSSSITIIGLPCKSDDTRDVIINAINKIGVEITFDDIVSINEIHKKSSGALSKDSKSKSHEQNLLVVKFTTAEIKNNILLHMRERKSLSTKDLDVFLPQNHPEQRIFIMHRLTAFQSLLYREAKKIKTMFNFKYLWCKNGQIYLRKSADFDAHRIHSLNDIFRLQRLHQQTGSSGHSI